MLWHNGIEFFKLSARRSNVLVSTMIIADLSIVRTTVSYVARVLHCKAVAAVTQYGG